MGRYFLSVALEANPNSKIEKMKPIKYPPVGPANFVNPPENPEKTGSPTRPNRRYKQ